MKINTIIKVISLLDDITSVFNIRCSTSNFFFISELWFRCTLSLLRSCFILSTLRFQIVFLQVVLWNNYSFSYNFQSFELTSRFDVANPFLKFEKVLIVNETVTQTPRLTFSCSQKCVLIRDFPYFITSNVFWKWKP